MDREGIPIPWPGLELSYDSRLYRERFVLNAFPRAMARVRAAGRKRHPSLVLVLEYRRKRPDVRLFYFPTRSGRHPGLSAKLSYLHSQPDAHPEAQVRFHGRRTVATPTRNGIMQAAKILDARASAALRLRFLARRLGSLRFLFFRLTDHRRDRLKLFTVAKVHQFYTHRVAAGLTNLFDPGSHHLAFVRDQHDLVCFANCERANHVAGFLAGSHRDDAFAAARLPPVIIKRRPLADSIFASDEQHSVWIDNGVGHDMVAFLRANSPNADSVAALIAQLFFMEAQAHSVFRDQDDLVVAVR